MVQPGRQERQPGSAAAVQGHRPGGLRNVNGVKGEAKSVAADQTSMKAPAAESAIARYARAVAQPGGMNIDWPMVRATGEIIAGLTAIHGLRYRKWEYVHTFGVVLGIAATAVGFLKNKYGEAPRPTENK
jgi:hypothetical protein